MKTKTKKSTKPKIEVMKPQPKNQALAVVKEPQYEDQTLALIHRAARDKRVDVAKMRELMNMKLDYEKMLRQDAFQQAMIACQKELPEVVRDAKNKDNHSRYAKLETIAQSIKPVYQKHGFSLSYTSRMEDGQKFIGCTIMHVGGHKEYHELPGDIEDAGMHGGKNKTPLQGLGVMVSYLRRYLAIMIFDVILVDEDLDGSNVDTETKQQQSVEQKLAATPTPEAEVVKPWKPDDGVVISSKTCRLDYSKSDADPLIQAVGYLRSVMGKRNHKASRIGIINENLSLVAALVKSNQGNVVAELHALADEGKA